MPWTAWTMPSSVLNSTTRSRIESTVSCSGTDSPLLRVERVTQAVADEVDRDDDDQQRQAREDRDPPVLRALLAVGDQRAERGRRRLDPEAEERERGLDDDRGADRQGAVDDDRAERVREDVPEHDPHVARARGFRGLDVLLL